MAFTQQISPAYFLLFSSAISLVYFYYHDFTGANSGEDLNTAMILYSEEEENSSSISNFVYMIANRVSKAIGHANRVDGVDNALTIIPPKQSTIYKPNSMSPGVTLMWVVPLITVMAGIAWYANIFLINMSKNINNKKKQKKENGRT
jgi:hypothetical protein